MSKSFLSKKRLIALLTTQVGVLTAAVVLSTIAWYSNVDRIAPDDAKSSVITSYFDGGDGTSEHPYCITAPIHYYNLVYLQENNYGFDSNTHFQFGKLGLDTTKPTEYKFYKYNQYGVLQEGEYSNFLDLNYYSGDKALAPLGSPIHPFVSTIYGRNLTVRNIHIKGDGCSDIGIFGFVGSSASVSNLYFDGVDIDYAGSSTSYSGNDSSHAAHNDLNIGYIAGHIASENIFNNVYVNNTCIRNSETEEFNVSSTYAYFGKCDYVSTPLSGGESYHYSLNPSSVYNYFDARYTALQNQTLNVRNTEDNNVATQVSTALTKSTSGGTHYSYVGDKNGIDASRNYSLATTGASEMDDFYELEYYNETTYSRSFSANTIVTDTAPGDMQNTGTFMYYDANKSLGKNSKWVYYEVSTQGEQTTQDFNCFLASYVDSGGTTHYLKFSNDTLIDETGVTPALPAQGASSSQIATAISNYGDYYFVLKPNQNSLGVTSIEDGVEADYYIFNPKNNKYLTFNRNVQPQTTNPCPRGVFTSTFSEATSFSLKGGRNGTIEFTHPTASEDNKTCGLTRGIGTGDWGVYVKKITGQTPALSITFTGITQDSESKTVNTYSKLTNTANIGQDSTIAFLGYDSTSGEECWYAMSTTQNTNNRGRTDKITFTNNTFTNEGLTTLAEFKIKMSGSLYTFYDEANTGYLAAASSNSNHLKTVANNSGDEAKWTISLDASNDYEATVQDNSSYTRDKIMYNFSANLFACYNGDGDGRFFPDIYYVTGTTTGYKYTSNARTIPFVADGGGSYSRVIYPTYYKEIGGDASGRQALDVSADRISNWVFSESGESLVAFTQNAYQGWCRVADASQLEAGETYVIAPGNPATYPNTLGELSGSGTFGFNPVSTTFNDDQSKISTLGEGTLQFVLEGTTDSWKFKNGENYINYAAEGNSHNGNPGLSTEDSNNTFSISVVNGVATLMASGGSAKLQYYSSSSYYRFYTTNQQGASLYRFYPQNSDELWFADEIKAGYDTDYNPEHVDVVGGVDMYSNYMQIDDGAMTQMKSVAYWDAQSSGVGSYFYQTYYTSSAIVLKVPNYGSLDYGTLTIKVSGSTLPAFMKGSDATNKSVSFADVECENEGTSGEPLYKLSLNPYNIYKLCYCTLDDNGNIYSAYDANGSKTVPSTNVHLDDIAEFVLVIGCASGSTKITDLDLEFTSVKGNTGDFGTVGFRSATYSGGADANGDNAVNSSSVVPGEVINFTYNIPANESIGIKVIYNSSAKTYTIYIDSSVATTVYLFNYDAERAKVSVIINGGSPINTYRESYNEIAVSAAGSVPSGGFMSSYTVITD